MLQCIALWIRNLVTASVIRISVFPALWLIKIGQGGNRIHTPFRGYYWSLKSSQCRGYSYLRPFFSISNLPLALLFFRNDLSG